MDQLDNLKNNVLDSEEADKAKDQVSSIWEKYGDLFMGFLRFFIYFLSL